MFYIIVCTESAQNQVKKRILFVFCKLNIYPIMKLYYAKVKVEIQICLRIC